MTHGLPSGMIAGKGIVVFVLFLFTVSIAVSATGTPGMVGTVVVATGEEGLDPDNLTTFLITSNEDPGDVKF